MEKRRRPILARTLRDMSYTVTVTLILEPDDVGLFPDGKMPLATKKFFTLSKAKEYADMRIEKEGANTVIVVSEHKGRAKYRAEKDGAGHIKRVPLV